MPKKLFLQSLLTCVVSLAGTVFPIYASGASTQPVILDVRTPAEFAESHVVGATNINVLDPEFEALIDKLDKSKKYVVYCRSGSRSERAIKIMSAKGFAHTENLETAKKTAEKLKLKCEGKSESC